MVLASAVKRLGLYEEAYGYTRLRLTADAVLLWLGALFCLLLASRGAAWLPRAAVALTGAAVLAFAASNPERRIAAHNLERLDRTGRVDRWYLSTLGADAAPVLGVRCRGGGGVLAFNLARTRCS